MRPRTQWVACIDLTKKHFYQVIAVATIEADQAIASSAFLKIMGISSQKGVNRRDSGQL